MGISRFKLLFFVLLIGVAALVLHPGRADLAGRLADSGRLEQAASLYRRLVAGPGTSDERLLEAAVQVAMQTADRHLLRSSYQRLAAAHPEDPSAWRALAGSYHETLEVSDEVRCLERVRALAPGDRGSRTRLAAHYRRHKKAAALEAVLLELAAGAKDPTPFLAEVARTALGRAETQAAFAALDRLLALHPTDEARWRERLDVAHAAGGDEALEAVFARARDALGRGPAARVALSVLADGGDLLAGITLAAREAVDLPADERLLSLLKDLVWSRPDARTAATALERGFAGRDAPPALHALAARAWERAGDIDRAIRHAERVARAQLRDRDARRYLASLREAKGDLRGARRELRTLSTAGLATRQDLLHQADLAIATKDAPAAVRTLEAARRRFPDDEEVLRKLVDARAAAEDPQGAARDLAALSKKHPTDAALLARLAETRGWAEDVSGQVRALRAAVRLAPTDRALEQRLVDALLAAERLREAAGIVARRAEADRAAGDRGEAAKGLARAAELSRWGGDDPFAARCLTQALELAPSDLALRERLVDAREAAGDPDGAARALERLLAERLESEPLWLRLAELHLQAHHLDRAVEVLHVALDVLPESDAVARRLTDVLQGAGREKEATELLLSRARERGQDPAAWREAARVALEASRLEDAVQSLEHAVSLRPQDPALWRQLATVASWQGDLERSANAWARVQALEPEDTQALAARIELASWRDRPAEEARLRTRRLAAGQEATGDLTRLVALYADNPDIPARPEVLRRATAEVQAVQADPDLRASLGQVLAARAPAREAVSGVQALRAQAPTDPRLEGSLVAALWRARRYSAARRRLRRMIARARRDAPALLIAAQTAATIGDPGSAYLAYAAQAALEPRDGRTFLEAGKAALWAGEPHAARTLLVRAVRLQPRSAAAHLALAQALDALGDAPEAVRRTAHRARVLYADPRADERALWAEAASLSGDVRAALGVLRPLYARTPEDVSVELALARVLLRAGAPEEALRHAEAVHRHAEPRSAVAREAQAVAAAALEARRHPKAAAARLRSVAREETRQLGRPSDATRGALASALEQDGRWADALALTADRFADARDRFETPLAGWGGRRRDPVAQTLLRLRGERGPRTEVSGTFRKLDDEETQTVALAAQTHATERWALRAEVARTAVSGDLPAAGTGVRVSASYLRLGLDAIRERLGLAPGLSAGLGVSLWAGSPGGTGAAPRVRLGLAWGDRGEVSLRASWRDLWTEVADGVGFEGRVSEAGLAFTHHFGEEGLGQVTLGLGATWRRFEIETQKVLAGAPSTLGDEVGASLRLSVLALVRPFRLVVAYTLQRTHTTLGARALAAVPLIDEAEAHTVSVDVEGRLTDTLGWTLGAFSGLDRLRDLGPGDVLGTSASVYWDAGTRLRVRGSFEFSQESLQGAVGTVEEVGLWARYRF